MKNFNEIDGVVDVDPRQAASFLRAIFSPTDYVAVTAGRNNTMSRGFRTITQVVTCSELVQQLESGIEGANFLYSLCAEPEPFNVYFHIASVNLRADDPRHRVKEGDVAKVKALYVDLDVKPGCFASKDEAWQFLGSVPVRPSAVVSSGSGGLHAYWRIGRSGLPAQAGKDLLVHWWAYLSELAGERHIDKLVDVTRMSRLPGTIRWPKPGEDARPAPVELIYLNPKSEVTNAQILSLTKEPMERLSQRRIKTREKDESLRKKVEVSLTSSSAGKKSWKELFSLGTMEEWVNLHLPWESILVPAGWTHYGTDGEGRQLWSRPGERTKSAAVDWPESPYVMSLLSTSPETKLFDLLDADITLTKWRVMLRLNFADDYNAAVQWVLQQMERT